MAFQTIFLLFKKSSNILYQRFKFRSVLFIGG